MQEMNKPDGFTLIEAIIALFIVATLSTVVTISVIQSLNSGKIARAQSDCAAIAKNVAQLRADSGFWPTRTIAGAAESIDNLITGTAANVPPGNDAVATGASRWGSFGVVDLVPDQLISNAPGYSTTDNPRFRPGWNGPYLNSDVLDSWGNSYMINVRFLRANGPANSAQHNVFVLSAGPNGTTETPFDDATVGETLALGDDIGSQVR